MQDYVGTTICLLCLFKSELRRAVTSPVLGLRAVTIALGDDFHLVGHHEGGIEAQSEMSYDGVGLILVFGEEVGDAGESYLVDILVYLLSRHAYATVTDGQRLGVGVELHAHGQVARLALEVAFLLEGFQLLRGINGVRYHLAKENLMV